MPKVSAVDISHSLSGIDFPADKNNIVSYAQEHKANPDVINALQQIPERKYQNMADVERSFGEVR